MLFRSDRFLRTLNATPTLNQDNQTIAFDDKNLQIFTELGVKPPDILMAVNAIVAARKKGQRGTADADGMGGG